MIEADQWENCYDQGWQAEITPNSFLSVPTETIPLAAHRPCTRFAFTGTGLTTETLLSRCVSAKGGSASRAIYGHFSGKHRTPTFGAKFIKQYRREPWFTQFLNTSNGCGRDTNIWVRSVGIDFRRKFKCSCEMFCQTTVFIGCKLLGGNSDTGTVPGTIITDKTGERNRMIKQREVFPADYFLSSARIKNLSEVGKAWNRNRVESSAFPCFPIAFIKIGAPLNRARYWSKPFMFSLKPRGLLDCVVAGQMKIFPIGRTRQGGISEKRPDSNVPLKFSQLNA